MKLEELRKLIKLCRDTGVESLKIEGVELTLGANPQAKRPRGRSKLVELQDEFESESLTQEQLLNWSVTTPGEDGL